jgi:ABC-type Zn2+ transport system substrate-binding protein/surface adhesin
MVFMLVTLNSETYAKSINHDTTKMYKEFASKHGVEDDEDLYKFPEDEYDDDDEEDDDEEDDDEEDDDEEEDDDDEILDDIIDHDSDDVDTEVSQKLTEEAIKLAEAGKAKEALGLFQKAVDANPGGGRMWENLGVTQMRSKHGDLSCSPL